MQIRYDDIILFATKQSGRTPVLEEAMTSLFYCFARKSQNNKPKEIWALRKAWFKVPSFNIRECQSLIIERSLSESWELLTERIDKIFVILEGPSKKPPPFWSPSNLSTCSYVLFSITCRIFSISRLIFLETTIS